MVVKPIEGHFRSGRRLGWVGVSFPYWKFYQLTGATFALVPHRLHHWDQRRSLGPAHFDKTRQSALGRLLGFIQGRLCWRPLSFRGVAAPATVILFDEDEDESASRAT
jgi:hypothetical protein